MKAKRIVTAALCAVLICITACTSTVTPQTIEPTQASYDESSQNSGIVATISDENGEVTGWIITARAKDRYNALIERLGASMWSPAIGEDYGVTPYAEGRYYLTNEAMAKFVAMAEKARMSGN